jgi:hypothetical protein
MGALGAIAGCGGSEEPGTPPAEVASSAPASAPATAPAAPVTAEKALAAAPETSAAVPAGETPPGANLTALEEFIPVAAEVDGPAEYEEGVEQPLVAEFPAEKASQVPRPEIADLPSDDELLGKPLVINDEVIPFDEIKKQVCLAGSGAAEIEQQKLRIFVEEEKKRRTESGQDAGLVQDDDVQGFVSELEAELQR